MNKKNGRTSEWSPNGQNGCKATESEKTERSSCGCGPPAVRSAIEIVGPDRNRVTQEKRLKAKKAKTEGPASRPRIDEVGKSQLIETKLRLRSLKG